VGAKENMTSEESQVNPKKLFVGNLPWSMTEDQLTELFSQHGELVSVKLIIDKMSGRSKGIAFVEYATEEMANQAMEAVNGMEVEGRALVVNVARPFQPRERVGGRDFGGGNNYRGGNRGGDRGGFNRRG
jgi:RNA recognition motif-containing protein